MLSRFKIDHVRDTTVNLTSDRSSDGNQSIAIRNGQTKRFPLHVTLSLLFSINLLNAAESLKL